MKEGSAGMAGAVAEDRGGPLPAALLFVFLSLLSLPPAVCAEEAAPAPGAATAEQKPGEEGALGRFNRSMFSFNREYAGSAAQDTNRFFADTVPGAVRQGISNFLSNLGEPLTAVASMAEGDYANARIAAQRFFYNTTLGYGGVLDKASEEGIRGENRGLSDVLCRYDLPEGPFLVVPFYGPATVGDFFGSVLPVVAGYVALGEAFWLYRASSRVAAYVAGEGGPDGTDAPIAPPPASPAAAAPSTPAAGEGDTAYLQVRERYLAERQANCEAKRAKPQP